MALPGKWHNEWGRNDATRAIEKGLKIYNEYHPRYVWGGGTLRGIDCSHFVCACYFGKWPDIDSFTDYNYLTTSGMVDTPSFFTQRNFTRLSYSLAARKAGDILVFKGHTGLCMDGYKSSNVPSSWQNPYWKVIQSTEYKKGSGKPGVTISSDGGSWTHIYRPKEGVGIYITSMTDLG